MMIRLNEYEGHGCLLLWAWE